MATEVQISCINKRPGHHDPHKRIQSLGGVHSGKPWKMSEDDMIAELEKPANTRQRSFYTTVHGNSLWVVVATHNGQKYLKTQPDRHPENSLLHLPECP
jgi:hypothetical protein